MILLVVDVQSLIVTDELFAKQRFIDYVSKLIAQARTHAVEVIFIRHDDGEGEELTKGTLGYEIFEAFAPQNGEMILDKQVNSPFRDTGLLEYLKKKKEKEIMTVGLQTDYCMDATVKCGFEHKFKIIVPEYTNTTVDNEFMTGEQTYHYYNDKIWKNRYAECITIEEAVKRIVQ